MTTLAVLDVRITATANELGRAAAQANAATASIARGVATANRATQTFDQRLQRTATTASTVGSALTRGVTLPVAAMAAASVKAAVDFESSFAGVRKTVDGTEKEFAKLSAGLRKMATEIPVGVNELNRIAEAAGALGIAKEDILGFTRVVADMSVTTDLTADAAATALGKLANILGLTGDEYERLASTIVDLGNKGASTESEIVEFTLRLAGAAKGAGFATEEIAGLAAALADAGLNAEAGGSAMSRTINEIGKAVALGTPELAKFAEVSGQTADKFVASWERDPAMALAGFLDGLSAAQKEGQNLDVILDSLGITELRQVDTLKRLANAQNDVASRIRIASKAWAENQALVEEARKRYQTMEGQWKTLQNQLIDIAIDVGPTIIPLIRDLAEGFKSIAEAFGSLPRGTQAFIVKMLLLGAALGPALKALSGFLTVLRGVSLAFKALRTVKTAGVLADTAAGLAGVGTQLDGLPGKVGAFDRIFRTSLSQMSGFTLGFAGTLGVVGAALAGWQIGTQIYENLVRPMQEAKWAAEDAQLAWEANMAVFDAVGKRVPEIATAMHDVTTELRSMHLDGNLSAEALARVASAENVSALRSAAEAGANMAAATRAIAGGMSAAALNTAVNTGILNSHAVSVASVADETGRVVTLMRDAAGNTKAFVEHGGKITTIDVTGLTVDVDALAGSLGIGRDQAAGLVDQLNSIPASITTTYTLKAIIDPALTGQFTPGSGAPPAPSGDLGDILQGPIKASATGNHLRAAEMSWVGERGVELFAPDVPGTIIPNHEIKSFLLGRGGRSDRYGYENGQFSMTASERNLGDTSRAGGVVIVQHIAGSVWTERELIEKARRELIRDGDRNGRTGIR